MRELTFNEVEGVSGGYHWGTSSTGIFSPTNIAQATNFTKGLGFVGAAATAGYSAGNYFYNNYGQTDWFTSAADSFFDGLSYIGRNWWNG